jgi:hypothetical protein
MQHVFAVKQKSTGRFLPAPSGRTGGSWVEPTNLAPPRIFKNHHSAACAMRAWLMGHFKMVTNTNWEGDIDIDLEVEPVEGRSADDMEVVKLQLIEVAQ